MTETSILLIRAAREEYPAVQDNKFSVIVRLYHKYAPERYAIEYWPKDLILTGHQVKEDKTIAYFFELLHPPAQQDGTND